MIVLRYNCILLFYVYFILNIILINIPLTWESFKYVFNVIIVLICIVSICRFYVSLPLILNGLVCIFTYDLYVLLISVTFYVSLYFDIVYLYIHAFIESRGLANFWCQSYLFYNIPTINKILLILLCTLTCKRGDGAIFLVFVYMYKRWCHLSCVCIHVQGRWCHLSCVCIHVQGEMVPSVLCLYTCTRGDGAICPVFVYMYKGRWCHLSCVCIHVQGEMVPSVLCLYTCTRGDGAICPVFVYMYKGRWSHLSCVCIHVQGEMVPSVLCLYTCTRGDGAICPVFAYMYKGRWSHLSCVCIHV